MKKSKVLFCLVVFAAFLMAGCVRLEESFVVGSDNKVNISVEQAYEKAKTEELLLKQGMTSEEIAEMMKEFQVKTIDGKEFYADSVSRDIKPEDLITNFPNFLITKDKFYMYAAAENMSGNVEDNEDINHIIDEMLDMGLNPKDIYVIVRVNMPSEIVKTNGNLQEDKRTVEWKLDTSNANLEEIYAYTQNDPADMAADRKKVEKQLADVNSTEKPEETAPALKPAVSEPPKPRETPIINKTEKTDKKAPVIKGVKKNKTYKKKVTVYVKDNKQLKKVTLNGKRVTLKKVLKGKFKGYYNFMVKKKGKISVIAYDTAGNKKKMTFQIK